QRALNRPSDDSLGWTVAPDNIGWILEQAMIFGERPAMNDCAYLFPVSFAQQRLWFLDQLLPGNPFYNIPAALRLKTPLNVTALRRSLNEIVRRHEVLRTCFTVVDGQPVQMIAPVLELELPVAELRGLP